MSKNLDNLQIPEHRVGLGLTLQPSSLDREILLEGRSHHVSSKNGLGLTHLKNSFREQTRTEELIPLLVQVKFGTTRPVKSGRVCPRLSNC